MTDLQFNYPSVDSEARVLLDFLQQRNHRFEDLLRFPDYGGTKENREAVSRWLEIDDLFQSGLSNIVVANSANQSLNCLLQTLRQSHSSIITEPFTYPAFKVIALQKGFRLYPSTFDENGLTTEGLEQTLQQTGARLIYLQPTIHNPTCAVMPVGRRKEIAELAKAYGALIIEDDAYRFLHPNPPQRLLDLLPENTFFIFSLSKPFNPFIKTSYIITPAAYVASLTENIRWTSSGQSSLLGALATYLLQHSFLDGIIAEKQQKARQIHSAISPLLDGISYQTFSTSFHIWISLPPYKTSQKLVAELAAKEIRVPDALEFLAGDNVEEGSHFIRIALGAEKEMNKLVYAVRELAGLIKQ